MVFCQINAAEQKEGRKFRAIKHPLDY
jgi:hypothetical protein